MPLAAEAGPGRALRKKNRERILHLRQVKAGEREEERLAREVGARVRTWAGESKRSAGADSPPRLAIKFCGGCNPVIDRGQLAGDIRENLSGLVRWVPAEEETDLLLIICGCLTACADRPGVTEKTAEYLIIAGGSFSSIRTGAENRAERPSGGKYGAQGEDTDRQTGP
jgi:hypothetical protein